MSYGIEGSFKVAATQTWNCGGNIVTNVAYISQKT